jgi:hypothetical protein
MVCHDFMDVFIDCYWSNSTDGKERPMDWAKVSWNAFITPTPRGGLGIIDPLDQCHASFAKTVVRAFLPGNENWKKL